MIFLKSDKLLQSTTNFFVSYIIAHFEFFLNIEFNFFPDFVGKNQKTYII